MPLFGPPNIEAMVAKKDLKGLKKAMDHKDFEIREEAYAGFKFLQAPKKVQDAVLKTKSPDPATRAEGAKEIGLNDWDTGLSGHVLEKLIRRDPDVTVRRQAVAAIGSARLWTRLEVLIEMLGDPDETIRKNAVWALGVIGTIKVGDSPARIRDSLLRILAEDTPAVRAAAADTFSRWFVDELYDPQVKALMHDVDAQIRQKTADGLGRAANATRSHRAIQALLEMLRDENQGVRFHAARDLGEVGATQYAADDPFWQGFVEELQSAEQKESADEVRNLLHGALARTLKLQGYR